MEQHTPKTTILRTIVAFSGEVSSSYAELIKPFSGWAPLVTTCLGGIIGGENQIIRRYAEKADGNGLGREL